MHIRSQSPTEMVVVDSSMWISAICAAFAIMPAMITIRDHMRNGFYASGVILLIGLVWMRRTRFVFDAEQRMVRWNGVKMLAVKSGTIPFDEIRDIVMDSMPSDRGTSIYRLSIVTATDKFPMEYAYSGSEDQHEQVRKAILAFVHGRARSTERPAELP